MARDEIGKNTFRKNARRARAAWGELSKNTLEQLKDLTNRYALSVVAGDLQMLDGRWYVTHAGLLQIADRARCSGIRTSLQRPLSEPATNRWVFKATVYKTAKSHGTREMPIWGYAFMYRQSTMGGQNTASPLSEQEVKQKINRLVEYIKTLQ